MLPKIGNKQSLSEQAYVVIKNAILQNKIKPKDVLSEESLAADLGISRTPLRAALKRLEFERLVYINSSRQAVVAEVNAQDVSKVYTLRIAVEPVIAKLAARGLTMHYAEKLEENIRSQRLAIEAGDLVAVVSWGLEFDHLLAEAAGNEFLTEVVERLSVFMQRNLILSMTHAHDAPLSLIEHKNIFDAIKAGNEEAAERLSRLHLHTGMERLGLQSDI